MFDWKKVLVKGNTSILQVIEKIDATGLQIALVVDEDDSLLGTVTDGDIRRGILKGVSLKSCITEIMNRQPVSARVSDNPQTILMMMKKKHLRQIPVLDEEGKIVRIELLDRFIEKKLYPNPVVLMAGGLGTRLRPLTDHCPKPMLKLGDKPILELIIENFIEYGFYRFYISVNYHAEIIKNYFGDGAKWGAEIQYIDETERLGTAGALSYLADMHLDMPFFVMNGDLLTKVNYERLLEYHSENKAMATMCVREFEYQVPYGVVRVDDSKLLSIEEKPIQRYFINGGLYVLQPETLELIPRGKYYDMPELFQGLIANGHNTTVFPILEYWIDIGRMDDLKRANVDMEAGVI
ncbi:MAG: nucleotidyltransferase family protein [Paenibacillus dendritiformis]|uniref:nucleotidyltransferase family protein n=1 Tax=uncultured Paenibacillus sp. TaxID=227322 RepID=UPI0025D75513|nr:nucleotidyltransferase family protein [uncultured Paenibacillus sp.]MDU5141549.1 nucleotidyltransferase family protein [Paenibacillus dendritiformis]